MNFVWWISVLALCAASVEGRGGQYCPAIPKNIDIHIETAMGKHKKSKSPSTEGHAKQGKGCGQKKKDATASLAFASDSSTANAWEAPGDPWDIYGPMSTLPSDHGSDDAHNKGSKLTVQVVAKPDSQASDGFPFSSNDWSQPPKMALSPGTDGMQVAPNTPWAMDESLKRFPWQKVGNVKNVTGKAEKTSPTMSFTGDESNYGGTKRVQCLMCKLQHLVREGSSTSSNAGQKGKSDKVSRIVGDGIKQLMTKETELRNKLSNPGINNSEKRILLEQLSEVRRLQVEVYKSKLLTHKGSWNAQNCDCSKCNGGSNKKHSQQSSGAAALSPSTTKPPKLSSPKPANTASVGITAPTTKPKKIDRTPKVTSTTATSPQPTASKTISKASHGTNQPAATEKPKVIIIRNTVFVCKDGRRPRRPAKRLTPTTTKGIIPEGPATKPILSVPSAVPLSPSATGATRTKSLGSTPSSLPTASAQPSSPITSAPKPLGSPANATGSGATRDIKPKPPTTLSTKQGPQPASQVDLGTKNRHPSQPRAALGAQQDSKPGPQNVPGEKPAKKQLKLDGLSIDKLKAMRADYLERLKSPNIVAQTKAEYWETFQKINGAIAWLEAQRTKLDEKGIKDLASKALHAGKKIAKSGRKAVGNLSTTTPEVLAGVAGDAKKNDSKNAAKAPGDAHNKAPATVELKKKLQLDAIKAILSADV